MSASNRCQLILGVGRGAWRSLGTGMMLGEGAWCSPWRPRSLSSLSHRGFSEAPPSCMLFPVPYMGELGPDT